MLHTKRGVSTFVYPVSSSEYNIHPSRSFPWDSWAITVIFYTYFEVEFDPKVKYSTISPNYVCAYSTKYQGRKDDGSYQYQLNIDIEHPSSFAYNFMLIYGIPLALLGILAVC